MLNGLSNKVLLAICVYFCHVLHVIGCIFTYLLCGVVCRLSPCIITRWVRHCPLLRPLSIGFGLVLIFLVFRTVSSPVSHGLPPSLCCNVFGLSLSRIQLSVARQLFGQLLIPLQMRSTKSNGPNATSPFQAKKRNSNQVRLQSCSDFIDGMDSVLSHYDIILYILERTFLWKR